MGKYKFYNDGKNKIVAVSTYAGRTVRGVAKCDPRDEFDASKGEDLAMARCAEKIALKRTKRAAHELQKALDSEKAAKRRVEKMKEYLSDSTAAWVKATETRENFEREF
jgi:hypothetical protein